MIFGAHDVPLFCLCAWLPVRHPHLLRHSLALSSPMPCRSSGTLSSSPRCPPAARGLRCTGLLRLRLQLCALADALACAHLMRTRVPSSYSSSLARGRVLRWWKLAQMSLCLKSDASSWLEAWVPRKSGSNNMTGRECARALRGAWCRVLASCNSGSAPRRGSGCTELWAGVPNVNKFGAFRRSFKRLKSST